jgi:thioredoxin 1
MHIPRLIDRARVALGARLWSWLGVGALVAVVGVAVVYSMTVEPSLRSVRSFGKPPYASVVDVRQAIAEGQARAAASGKILMVTFGANWCPDCLTLHDNLEAADARTYVQKHFEVVEIDVGSAKKSAAVQRDLGISVNAIPLAVFYSPKGEPIGDTFAGELKSSRHYSSREIRDFLREVVDYHRIVSPDQRQ